MSISIKKKKERERSCMGSVKKKSTGKRDTLPNSKIFTQSSPSLLCPSQYPNT